jgi:chromatin segregation and condensation protein Rec8/ScpA/Scc1 (kleisin family)
MLYERGTVEQAVFRRGGIESDENNTETNATVFDLLTVFQKILARHKEEVQMEIEREEMSLAEMLKRIRARIFQAKEINLLELFAAMQSKQELVLAFIAYPRIGQNRRYKFTARKTFGDIILKKV